MKSKWSIVVREPSREKEEMAREKKRLVDFMRHEQSKPRRKKKGGEEKRPAD